MDKYFKPDKFEADRSTETSTSQWNHWKKTFEVFLASIKAPEPDKLLLLYNHVSHTIYELISDCKSYKDAVLRLDSLYIKPKNEVFARHKLMTRQQQPGETIDQFLQALRLLSADCSFKDVSAIVHRDEYLRDAFINGLTSNSIRQRLLENLTLSLDDAFTKARSLESAQSYSESYLSNKTRLASIDNLTCNESPNRDSVSSAAATDTKCYFCGFNRHSRTSCPAREAVCRLCNKKGHYAKVCRSSKPKDRIAASGTRSDNSLNDDNWLAIACVSDKSSATNEDCSIKSNSSKISAAFPPSLSKSTIKMKINDHIAAGLVDTGSSESYISDAFVAKHKLQQYPTTSEVAMASSSLAMSIKAFCSVNLQILGNNHYNTKLNVLKDCCADVILGHDILRQHSSLSIKFGGKKPELQISSSVSCANVSPASLFEHLSPNCRPIAIKSRRHTEEDEHYIKNHIKELLSSGVIEESNSPWRAQVLVVRGTHRKRMVVDYSQTINRYTMLDAYPVPSIEKIVSKVAENNIHSMIDLKSAYYQIPIRNEDMPYTAFEAAGKLWQFKRIPMGVTNGVAAFQRKMDEIKTKEGLQGVNIYLDDVTVSGKTQDEHDSNLNKFLNVCKKYNLTVNKEKSNFNLKSIKILGYLIENNTLKPDPDRLEPLVNFPVPKSKTSLQRALGMFSYYAKWVPKFSDKIHRLVNCKKFPMDDELIRDFNDLRSCIVKSVVVNIEGNVPFCVETDASDVAIAAILTQNKRPVAFFSRTLSKSEQHHSAVEKEAYAVIESLRKWRHYLVGRKFQLITDQKSISYMFDTRHSGKIKNDKFTRWRLELAPYDYDIVYRPGKENVAADALSRTCGSSHTFDRLVHLHDALCHPGITRMAHWAKSQNLPYSMDEIRKVTSCCKTCAEIKPRFYSKQGNLIKATAPFERLSIDFKGPLPSNTPRKYLLTVVDEFSRFPFAIPCTDLSSTTVIQALNTIFTVFGYPSFIHSDRGTSFISNELQEFLHSNGVATSRTTPYNPCGNGQVERYNGIIWKTISLALKSKDLKISQWEKVLPESLHSIRSLLCTSTNSTPHERMFVHKRKSSSGVALPSWLTSPGKVLMKNQVRYSKYDPLVQEVNLLEANPDYALVQLPDGKETTVNLRHLAPMGEDTLNLSECRPDVNVPQLNSPEKLSEHSRDGSISSETESKEDKPASTPIPQTPTLRRSARTTQPPRYLKDYVPK